MEEVQPAKGTISRPCSISLTHSKQLLMTLASVALKDDNNLSHCRPSSQLAFATDDSLAADTLWVSLGWSRNIRGRVGIFVLIWNAALPPNTEHPSASLDKPDRICVYDSWIGILAPCQEGGAGDITKMVWGLDVSQLTPCSTAGHAELKLDS